MSVLQQGAQYDRAASNRSTVRSAPPFILEIDREQREPLITLNELCQIDHKNRHKNRCSAKTPEFHLPGMFEGAIS